MSHLSVKDVSAGYGKGNVIENISFTLESGEFMGIIGANGGGKTTLRRWSAISPSAAVFPSTFRCWMWC